MVQPTLTSNVCTLLLKQLFVSLSFFRIYLFSTHKHISFLASSECVIAQKRIFRKQIPWFFTFPVEFCPVLSQTAKKMPDRGIFLNYSNCQSERDTLSSLSSLYLHDGNSSTDTDVFLFSSFVIQLLPDQFWPEKYCKGHKYWGDDAEHCILVDTVVPWLNSESIPFAV